MQPPIKLSRPGSSPQAEKPLNQLPSMQALQKTGSRTGLTPTNEDLKSTSPQEKSPRRPRLTMDQLMMLARQAANQANAEMGNDLG